jgi:hypothetical protein
MNIFLIIRLMDVRVFCILRVGFFFFVCVCVCVCVCLCVCVYVTCVSKYGLCSCGHDGNHP